MTLCLTLILIGIFVYIFSYSYKLNIFFYWPKQAISGCMLVVLYFFP